jgi:hypothetical protein
MKRAIYLILVIAVLAILIYWLKANGDKSDSSISTSDRNFKVEQMEDIQSIFIADTKGQSNLLTKEKNEWYLNDTFLINDLVINNLLSTFKNIQLQFIPPNKAKEKIIDQFAQIGLKIELYGKNKEALKKFYIGGSTSDERGTYFLMEGSNQPYVMELPAFEGSLRGRFVVDKELWRDKTVFKALPNQIKKISVSYPKKKEESFILEKKLLSYDINPFYPEQEELTTKIQKDKVELYLEEFEELIAEAYENNHPRKDSITALVPFAEIELELEDGTAKKISLIPYDDIYRGAVTESVNQAQSSIRRYFISCDTGDFMLIQHNVFKGVLRGYAYFFED